jgi:predicted ATPase
MTTTMNPNSAKQYIDEIDLGTALNFPKFITEIELSPFRHIPALTVQFNHPISVIAGTNRSGKSTILMALACSHYNFNKRNIRNGALERQTWSSIMQFTNQDKQSEDWTYYITYKQGTKTERKKGQRKSSTKKWNGIGKKESQFKDRDVIFLDLDRVLPARHFGKVIFNKSQNATASDISSNNTLIQDYLSYVLEEAFELKRLATHIDKDILKYSNSKEYSSYNAAAGEEVLAKMIFDIVEAPKNSLILIDEIEVGLHPKIQRRLIDVLYHIAKKDSKQFILTSHSPAILSSLPDKARIFIEKTHDSNYKAIQNISVNAALSKMDSKSYPLVDLYCEDEWAKKIIQKAISDIQITQSLNNFSDLINIIISGSADNTYNFFQYHKDTYPHKKIKTGFACVLDGDQRNSIGEDECLHFIYSNDSPEKFLVSSYIKSNPNIAMKYHLSKSNVHCLFDKMIECSIGTTHDEVFDLCWNHFISTVYGEKYFSELKGFIKNMAIRYSPDL